MSDLRQITIDTYERSAEALAKYFEEVGSRADDVEKALELAGSPEAARVLEIGCGDGRDAEEIVPRVGSYEGFDISNALIKIARSRLPDANFKVADVMDYSFPSDLDVIYAFASLLHLGRDEVKKVFEKGYAALRPGGIFFVSLKHADEYSTEVKEDRFGTRLFYYYNPEIIKELAGDGFEAIDISRGFVTGGSTLWFETALKKI